MNNPTHLNHLKNLLTKERVLPVLGTGVSYWTSQGDSSSTWKGLLENGLDYCSTHISALPLNWEVTQRSLIDSGKANDFISVAERLASARC